MYKTNRYANNSLLIIDNFSFINLYALYRKFYIEFYIENLNN